MLVEQHLEGGQDSRPQERSARPSVRVQDETKIRHPHGDRLEQPAGLASPHAQATEGRRAANARQVGAGVDGEAVAAGPVLAGRRVWCPVRAITQQPSGESSSVTRELVGDREAALRSGIAAPADADRKAGRSVPASKGARRGARREVGVERPAHAVEARALGSHPGDFVSLVSSGACTASQSPSRSITEPNTRGVPHSVSRVIRSRGSPPGSSNRTVPLAQVRGRVARGGARIGGEGSLQRTALRRDEVARAVVLADRAGAAGVVTARDWVAADDRGRPHQRGRAECGEGERAGADPAAGALAAPRPRPACRGRARRAPGRSRP